MCWGWLPPVAAAALYMLYLCSKMSHWVSQCLHKRKVLVFPSCCCSLGMFWFREIDHSCLYNCFVKRFLRLIREKMTLAAPPRSLGTSSSEIKCFCWRQMLSLAKSSICNTLSVRVWNYWEVILYLCAPFNWCYECSYCSAHAIAEDTQEL